MVCEMTIGRPLFEGKSDLDQLQKIKSSLGQIAEFQLDELQKTGKQSNVKIIKQSNELFTFEKKFSDMNEKLFDFTKVKILKIKSGSAQFILLLLHFLYNFKGNEI